ncbi:MAG: L-aspartate oxidase [Balneolaceae bacterium]
MKNQILRTDFLIVGSGVAGLYAAYNASKYGKVILVTKSGLADSSSYWAQGGIAAVLQSDDTFSKHINDTYTSGRHFGNIDAIELMIKEGAKEVQQLIDLGMPFDELNNHLEFGLEGGHSIRRILHAGGASTGQVLIDFLLRLICESENIEVIDQAFVYQLIVDKMDKNCKGADVYLHQNNEQVRIFSKAVILATGGYSGLYSRTTNPHTSTGDGLWLSLETGAKLKDLEFIQFHPTAFYSEIGDSFLISEALRGEGAILLNHSGERFMEGFHQKELSPRDVVSREIYFQIEKSEVDYVFLDLRHIEPNGLRKKYVELMSKIESKGLDISKDLIPVSPAAHYCIGGVETDMHGHTSVHGLYACGEVANTGVHGANRLASNSLLECLVFGKRAAVHAFEKFSTRNVNEGKISERPLTTLIVDRQNEDHFIHLKKSVSELLNKSAGICRSEPNLKDALSQIRSMKKRIDKSGDQNEYYLLRSRGILEISKQIIQSALNRSESLGVHNRVDSIQSMEV